MYVHLFLILGIGRIYKTNCINFGHNIFNLVGIESNVYFNTFSSLNYLFVGKFHKKF